MDKRVLRLGFDAKRAFLNASGLGTYSRTLLEGLAENFPQHRYALFTPKTSALASKALFSEPFEIVTPTTFFEKSWPSWWRRYGITKAADKMNLDLYHGLSHELPVGIERTSIRTVISIHDLIFERFPEQYAWIDRQTYRHKIRHACEVAHQIITSSAQTNKDLVDLYGVHPEKIQVIYLTCHPQFGLSISSSVLEQVRTKYRLPARYILHVGAFNRRKNHLKLLQAYRLIPASLRLQVVLVAGKGSEETSIRRYMSRHGLEATVTILQRVPLEELVAIYRQAAVLVYNSLLEGFGIPILEGFHSGVPVITSTGSCFDEVGGEACLYVDPQDEHALAAAISNVCSDQDLRSRLISSGYLRSPLFTPTLLASNTMRLYQNLTY